MSISLTSVASWAERWSYRLNTGQAHIAQAVEHFLGKEEVTGSTPVMGSKLIPVSSGLFVNSFVK